MSNKEKKRPANIVPLKTHPPLVEAKRALDETSPQLVYHGGPLLTSVEVFNIFWGNDWNNDDRMKDLPF